MKRLLSVLLLCVIATPALARMDIRQKSDGTAVWQGRQTGNLENCVGGLNLPFSVLLNDGGITRYQPVNLTGAYIKNVYGVGEAAVTGTSIVKVYVNQLDDAIQFYAPHSSTTSTDAYLPFAGTSAGAVKRISTLGEIQSAWAATDVSLANNTTLQGGYIAVSSDGGTSSVVTAAVIVQVCPR